MADQDSKQMMATPSPGSGSQESSPSLSSSGRGENSGTQAVTGSGDSGRQLDGLERIVLQDKVTEVLRTCYDPEIPVNIYELGLIYEVRVEPSAEVLVKMTLTSPSCPAAASLPSEVQQKIKAIPDVAAAKVDVVWEPIWDPSKMSESARLQLGMF
jgi:FeS assembly SUF system protein